MTDGEVAVTIVSNMGNGNVQVSTTDGGHAWTTVHMLK
jgi:hypothetical protein